MADARTVFEKVTTDYNARLRVLPKISATACADEHLGHGDVEQAGAP